MGLIDDPGAGPVGLDTAVFIYYIEENPRYLPLVEPLFQAMDAGEVEGVTSAITLLEVLVVPYRSGNTPLAERYEALLTRGRGLRLFDLTRPLLRAAARLRATTGIKTPDALQVAAALSAGSSALVTNDDRWPKEVAGLPIVQLENYLGGSGGRRGRSTPASVLLPPVTAATAGSRSPPGRGRARGTGRGRCPPAPRRRRAGR